MFTPWSVLCAEMIDHWPEMVTWSPRLYHFFDMFVVLNPLATSEKANYRLLIDFWNIWMLMWEGSDLNRVVVLPWGMTPESRSGDLFRWGKSSGKQISRDQALYTTIAHEYTFLKVVEIIIINIPGKEVNPIEQNSVQLWLFSNCFFYFITGNCDRRSYKIHRRVTSSSSEQITS